MKGVSRRDRVSKRTDRSYARAILAVRAFLGMGKRKESRILLTRVVERISIALNVNLSTVCSLTSEDNLDK